MTETIFRIFAVIAAILLIIRQEERFLIEKFGSEYRKYMKITGRYLSKFYCKEIP